MPVEILKFLLFILFVVASFAVVHLQHKQVLGSKVNKI